MKYDYESLSSKQFEEVVIFICYELLGSGTQGFSEGPDGGRDAKFSGTAQRFPSESTPWKGITIVQAKHTNGFNKSFSEKDFFSPKSKSTIIDKELPRIQRLRENNELNFYMLFSNRRLTGQAESEICKYIAENTGAPQDSVRLFGIEQIELYMKQYPQIADKLQIDPLDSPLLVSPNDLATLIEALSKCRDVSTKILEKFPVDRTSYNEKNKLNNMTEEYAETLRKRYLKETDNIKDFLASPENSDFVKLYESVVDEFQFKIIAKKDDEQTFDNVMEYLVDLLFERDPILRAQKKLTRILLFYMYWNCDIGISNNAETE
ncbi:MAG: ABC-three component system protein [Gammaproteobacteria bacterium]